MGRAYTYVILGGGTAAGYAALEFVKQGFNHGELCIISEEAVAPYERPALCKGFLLPEEPARLPFFHTCVGTGQGRHLPRWYRENGVELILNTKVVKVNLHEKTLLTEVHETITYRTLIIATGARAMKLEEFGVPGSVAPNICYLRSVDDAQKLVSVMDSCKTTGGQAVVIGGGYIGMECAAALVDNKLPVTIVFPETHFMARLFTPEIAAFYEDHYTKKGVVFKKGTIIAGFERDEKGKVVAVQLDDGTRLQSDLVVVGVGIRPNVSLFERQLILDKGGIKVNGKMQTSNSSVYAVGDVVSFPIKMYGDYRKLEHVEHARMSAAHAVQAILAPRDTRDYDYMPSFYSRVFTLSWQFYGDDKGTCILFGDRASKKFGAYWVHKGRVVGTFLEGGSKEEYNALMRVARDQPEVEDLPLLMTQGMDFATLHSSQPVAPIERTLRDSLTEGHMLLSAPSISIYQVVAGLAAAAVVGGFSYWYSRRGRKW
ncbi:unnamed protein product [Calypogeia fissa]